MKKFSIILIILIVGALLAYRFIERRRVEATQTIAQIQAKEGYPVEVTPASLGEFNMTKTYAGTVVGVEFATVVSLLGEYIKEVKVSEGARVSEGQVICELARDNPTAGYQVAKLALGNAERDLRRVQSLFEQGAVSRQMLDHQALQRDLALEGLESIEKLLFVRAPIAGVVSKLIAEAGMFAAPGVPLAEIDSPERIRVKLEIPSSDRSHIRSGAQCVVSSGTESLAGEVSRIATSADLEGRSFTAYIRIPTEARNLNFSPGMMVEVDISVVDVLDAVTVDPDALNRSGETWRVFIVEGGVARLKTVDLGGKNGESAWIRSGVEAGALVVVSGGNLLSDGAPVRIISRPKGT